MLRRTVLHVSLCMLLAQHITGEPQNIDGLQNEDIVLCPVLDGKLEEITWKLGNNKVAEYDLFKIITYYGDFKEQTKLNITSGCLKMNNITDRRDGLYKAELQIRGKLQEREFKLKVYRPVSKPTVTCSVTDSNVTLLCEGDESLGDHYRWEDHENQVLPVTNEGKYLTFSKEENHNIEYTCIFSNLKSEERSDPVKNCFVPGGRSHIWVPILVFLAVLPVLAGLIVWGYKYYSQSQGRKTANYQAVRNEEGNSEPTTKNNMQSTLPLHGPQQCDVHVDATVNSKDENSSYHPVQMEEGNSETTTENNTRSTFPLHKPSQCDDAVYTTLIFKDSSSAHSMENNKDDNGNKPEEELDNVASNESDSSSAHSMENNKDDNGNKPEEELDNVASNESATLIKPNKHDSEKDPDVTPSDVQGMATTPLPARDMENVAAPPPLEIVKTPPTSETAGAPASPETAGAPASPETAGALPASETAVAPPSPETAAARPSLEMAAAPPPLKTAGAPPTSETAGAPPSLETAAAPPSQETAAAPPTSGTAAAPSTSGMAAVPPTPETAAALPASETAAAPPTSETAVAPPTPVTAATPPSLETASQAEPDSAEDQ